MGKAFIALVWCLVQSDAINAADSGVSGVTVPMRTSDKTGVAAFPSRLQAGLFRVRI